MHDVRLSGRALLPWALLVAPVGVLLAVLAAGTLRSQQVHAIGEALARGQQPPIPAVTLPSMAGRPVDLSSLRGHPVILNFWASWCVPCRDEAPQLQRIWETYRGQGLLVVGVNTQDLEGPARDFLRQYHITYLNLRDPDGKVARLFGTTGVPETFFIGADGRIRGKFPGAQLDPAAWQDAARALLAGRARVP